MRFVTIAEMSRTLRSTFHEVPHDVDFVLGVPRSGMLPATTLAEWLNVPCVDVDSFCYGADPTGGRRVSFRADSGRLRRRVLVVDDTIYNGGSMVAVREKLRFLSGYDIIYLAVFLEGPCSDVDVWLCDVRADADPFVLYEWNIFHHTPRIMSRCIYDIDGVLCVDPPDERDTDAYVRYIERPVPLFLPTVEIGEIVTYRLAAYEHITRRWLSDAGVQHKRLSMFPAQTYEERRASGIRPAEYKADIYAQRGWARLFVESDDTQAQRIRSITGKPVYCVQTNQLYT
jgi:hypoxanthine phosphoribosyltransferase